MTGSRRIYQAEYLVLPASLLGKCLIMLSPLPGVVLMFQAFGIFWFCPDRGGGGGYIITGTHRKRYVHISGYVR